MNPESADARIVRSIPGHVRLRCSLGVQSVQPCFLKVLDRRRDTDLKRVLQTLRRHDRLSFPSISLRSFPGKALGNLTRILRLCLRISLSILASMGWELRKGRHWRKK